MAENRHLNLEFLFGGCSRRRNRRCSETVWLSLFGVSQQSSTVALTLTEQMARTALRLVWPELSKHFLFSTSTAHIYLALQFMRSAFPPAFVGFQPQLRGVLSNRNGGRVTADLGLFVLLCKSHPPYLVTLISHRLCVMVRVHPLQAIIIQIGQAGFWLKPATCCILS